VARQSWGYAANLLAPSHDGDDDNDNNHDDSNVVGYYLNRRVRHPSSRSLPIDYTYFRYGGDDGKDEEGGEVNGGRGGRGDGGAPPMRREDDHDDSNENKDDNDRDDDGSPTIEASSVYSGLYDFSIYRSPGT